MAFLRRSHPRLVWKNEQDFGKLIWKRRAFRETWTTKPCEMRIIILITATHSYEERRALHLWIHSIFTQNTMKQILSPFLCTDVEIEGGEHEVAKQDTELVRGSARKIQQTTEKMKRSVPEERWGGALYGNSSALKNVISPHDASPCSTNKRQHKDEMLHAVPGTRKVCDLCVSPHPSIPASSIRSSKALPLEMILLWCYMWREGKMGEVLIPLIKLH